MWRKKPQSEVKWLFLGEYQHSIDQKGRVFIPSKFRESLGESFVTTKGFDNCLFVFPMHEWNNFEQKLKSLPLSSENARALIRFFTAGAIECEADKQGRILVPQNLREYAGLDKDVYIVGVTTRAEIWAKDKWDSYISHENVDINKIARDMHEMGMSI